MGYIEICGNTRNKYAGILKYNRQYIPNQECGIRNGKWTADPFSPRFASPWRMVGKAVSAFASGSRLEISYVFFRFNRFPDAAWHH
ncbi:MAG TPA: hypothetical protein VJ577_19130 [Burkholderiaceae bacterium]|nr:hypothetical protein [Burkholderiaceae bacterium]